MNQFTLENAPSQVGKLAIVTGANVGLGFETTIGLAKKGAKVVMACRSQEKAEKAKSDILEKVPDAELEIMVLDLNSLSSVRSFADAFKTRYDQLDILINNAGIMMPPFSLTEDGFESQFGVNHLGHFLLTGLLLPTLNSTQGSRVVALSSKAHEWGKIEFDNLQSEKKYSKMGAYGLSKLACLMFAYELDRRLDAAGSQVTSVAAHPGGSNTDLARHFPKVMYYILMPIMLPMMHSPVNAALPSLMAAIDESVRGGSYYGPTGFRGMRGKPGKVDSTAASNDKAVAKELWEKSEKLVDFKFVF